MSDSRYLWIDLYRHCFLNKNETLQNFWERASEDFYSIQKHFCQSRIVDQPDIILLDFFNNFHFSCHLQNLFGHEKTVVVIIHRRKRCSSQIFDQHFLLFIFCTSIQALSNRLKHSISICSFALSFELCRYF